MKYTLAVLGVFLFLPLAALAQDPGGLVNCSGPDCDFCAFVDLVNILVNWLFGFLVLAAVLVLMIAGFKLVVSSGNPSAMGEAKKMATNVIIGFVLVMSAWLIVDTIMKALIAPDSGFGMWNDIGSGPQCGGFNVSDTPESNEPMYCYESDTQDAAVPGLALCNEKRDELIAAGGNPNACHLCN